MTDSHAPIYEWYDFNDPDDNDGLVDALRNVDWALTKKGVLSKDVEIYCSKKGLNLLRMLYRSRSMYGPDWTKPQYWKGIPLVADPGVEEIEEKMEPYGSGYGNFFLWFNRRGMDELMAVVHPQDHQPVMTRYENETVCTFA